MNTLKENKVSAFRGNIYMIFVLIFMNFIGGPVLLMFLKFIGKESDVHITLLSTQLILFGVPFIIYMLITKRKLKDVLPLNPISLKNLGFILIIMIFVNPISSFISAVTTYFIPNVASDLLMSAQEKPFIYTLLIVAGLPSIFEEITFRGIIQSEYKKEKMWTIILVNGLFFGIMHGNFSQFFYASILGCLFSYLVYKTGSIYSTMFSHFILNGSSVVLIYAYDKLMLAAEKINPELSEQYFEQAVEEVSKSDMLQVIFYLGIVAVICFIILVLIMKKFNEYNNLRIKNEISNLDYVEIIEENEIEEKQEKHGRLKFIITLIIVIILGFSLALLNEFALRNPELFMQSYEINNFIKLLI